MTEITFEEEGKKLKLGNYNAIDYFDDGSFYLLDCPGVRCLSHHIITEKVVIDKPFHSTPSAISTRLRAPHRRPSCC